MNFTKVPPSDTVVFICLLITLVFLLYLYLTKSFDYWKLKNVSFAKPLPIVGNILNGVLMRQSFGEIFRDLYRKTQEPILGFFTFTKPCLLIRDPQIIGRILVSDFKYFYDRNILDNLRDDPISTQMLFFLKNPAWKEVRRKISPVYTSAKMKAMSTLINQAALEMIEYLDKEIINGYVIADMKEICMKFTVNVITSTVFGVDANAFRDAQSAFYAAAKTMINWDNFVTSFRIRCYFLAHSLVKMFRMRFLHPKSIDFLDESFWNIMNERSASKVRRNDLIDTLLTMKNHNQHFLGKDILTGQAVMFFVAGFETSSSTIGFLLYELAFHPEIQTKLRSEIHEIAAEFGGVTYDSLKEMKYLDMVVKETLRKYPVMPVLERKSNTRYTIAETGTVIDKDTAVFISTLSLHYDPRYFPDPEVFDPQRFSAENKHLIQSFTYLPFGEGPRNCIGARFGTFTAKMGAASILQNFIVEPTLETPRKIKFNPNGMALSPSHAVRLKVSRIR